MPSSLLNLFTIGPNGKIIQIDDIPVQPAPVPPFIPPTLPEGLAEIVIGDDGKRTFVMHPGYKGEGTLSIQSNITVDRLSLDRVFTEGVPSTVYFPFDIDTRKIPGFTFQIPVAARSRTEDNVKFLTCEYTELTGIIKKNTAMCVVSDGSTGGVMEFPEGPYVLNTVDIASQSFYVLPQKRIRLDLHGSYSYFKFGDLPDYQDPNVKYFGIASKHTDTYEPGDFAGASEKASIGPFKYYARGEQIA